MDKYTNDLSQITIWKINFYQCAWVLFVIFAETTTSTLFVSQSEVRKFNLERISTNKKGNFSFLEGKDFLSFPGKGSSFITSSCYIQIHIKSTVRWKKFRNLRRVYYVYKNCAAGSSLICFQPTVNKIKLF